MKATIDYIQKRFDEYNELYFGETLPTLPIRLSHAKGFLGKVTFVRRRQWLFGPFRNENFVLRINAEGNRHIRISYRLSPEQIAALQA